jgi:hypothetical protein
MMNVLTVKSGIESQDWDRIEPGIGMENLKSGPG